jgi:hypothetical protein
MRVASLLGVLVVGLMACSTPRPRPARRPLLPPPPPAFARVYLTGATIAPNKYDGSPWDGFGHVPPELPQKIATALQAPNPYAAVLVVLAEPTAEALKKPETKGRAMLLSRNGPSAPIPLFAQRDAFTPQWRDTPSFAHVPLDGSTRIHIEIMDADLAFDDPMGSFDIHASDILEALRAGGSYQVRVAERANQQVLFVGVSVFPE